MELWGQTICEICGQPILTEEEKSLDHIVPLKKGGDRRLENLRVAHIACNSRKKDKVLMSDWV